MLGFGWASVLLYHFLGTQGVVGARCRLRLCHQSWSCMPITQVGGSRAEGDLCSCPSHSMLFSRSFPLDFLGPRVLVWGLERATEGRGPTPSD